MRITAPLFAALCCATFNCAAGQARGMLMVGATLLAPTCLEAPEYKGCIPHTESRKTVLSHQVLVSGTDPSAPGNTRVVDGATTIVTIEY